VDGAEFRGQHRGDIESNIALKELEKFYGRARRESSALETRAPIRETAGSNGFAIAPKTRSAATRLLLINRTRRFIFGRKCTSSATKGSRPTARDVGQFFVYQGSRPRRLDAHVGRRRCRRRIFETVSEKKDMREISFTATGDGERRLSRRRSSCLTKTAAP